MRVRVDAESIDGTEHESNNETLYFIRSTKTSKTGDQVNPSTSTWMRIVERHRGDCFECGSVGVCVYVCRWMCVCGPREDGLDLCERSAVELIAR